MACQSRSPLVPMPRSHTCSMVSVQGEVVAAPACPAPCSPWHPGSQYFSVPCELPAWTAAALSPQQGCFLHSPGVISVQISPKLMVPGMEEMLGPKVRPWDDELGLITSLWPWTGKRVSCQSWPCWS